MIFFLTPFRIGSGIFCPFCFNPLLLNRPLYLLLPRLHLEVLVEVLVQTLSRQLLDVVHRVQELLPVAPLLVFH